MDEHTRLASPQTRVNGVEVGLGRRQNFANGEIVPIASGRRVVDQRGGAAQGSSSAAHLNPVRVTDRAEILVHKILSRAERARNRIVIIIANANHKRTISGGD